MSADYLAHVGGLSFRRATQNPNRRERQKKPLEIKNQQDHSENYLDEKLYQSSVIQDVAGFTVFWCGKDKVAIIEEIPYDNYFPDFRGAARWSPKGRDRFLRGHREPEE